MMGTAVTPTASITHQTSMCERGASSPVGSRLEVHLPAQKKKSAVRFEHVQM